MLRQGTCGNGVVDPGEDCDEFAPDGQLCGPPETAVACRFTCAQDSQGDAPTCPSGWQCGTDSICRAASGAYIPMGVPIEAAVERVLLGDFQGNGRGSVLGLGSANAVGAAYARLFFVQEDGTTVESSLLGFPVVSPQIRDLSGDGGDDFVFSVLGGLGVLLGQPAEELLPVHYPLLTLQQGASTLAVPVEPHPRSVLNQQSVIFVSFEGQGAIEALDTANHTIAQLPLPHDRLAGEPVVADIIREPSAPCGEILVAYAGEPEVWLVQPCNEDGSWATPESALRLAATLPEGAVVDSGVFVADFNGDGDLDLLVGAQEGTTFIALGCGGGQFCTDPTDASSFGSVLPVEAEIGAGCSAEPPTTMASPIAVGDVNGDGYPDVVTPFEVLAMQILVWEPNVLRVGICPMARKLVGKWSKAKIADMNLDGRADVIAGSSAELDLDFYAGTGFDRMNLTRITTPAPVAYMTLGDFDGDLVLDLAVGLSGAAHGAEEARRDRLGISYGRIQQPPEPLVSVATFDGMDQVVSAYFDYGDAVEELGVVARNAEGMQTITVFLSSGGRQLLAPFGLSDAPVGPAPESEVEGTPLSIVLNDFNDDGNLDIGSFALVGDTCTSIDCRFRLWITPSGGEAELLGSVSGPELPADVQPFASSEAFGVEIAAFPIAVDIDLDGVGDLALLAPWAPDPSQTAAWWAKLDDAGALADVQLLTRGPLRLAAESHPIVAELDGDGQPDIVLLNTASSGRQVVITWGDGGLDLSHPMVVEVPEEPLGVALIHADTDGLHELIVVGGSAVYLVQRDPAEPRAWEAQPIEGIEGGTSVAVRDIDGDGIDDIAIADELGVRLYRGRAALP